MKILKVLGIIVVVLAVIFVVGSMFLPKTYTVTRSTVINAPDSVIYKNVADFNEFLKWNAWSKMDPKAKVTITGSTAQPGHLYQWDGRESGKGQMLIKETTLNKMVMIELRFLKPIENIADTQFDITTEGTGNKVTWTMSGESDGILSKWMCLTMDSMIGKDFEDGLRSLKEKSEAGK